MTNPPLEERDFNRLRALIHEVAGITLGDQKHQLVAGRLAPRLRTLGLSSYAEYLAFLDTDTSGAEVREFVNCITTNKTSFFREPHHFELLKNRIVPEIVARAAAGGKRRIRIWSAGCSMGHEPWTIAMTLAEALGSFAGWDIRILASDLDTEVLETAEAATYDELAIEEIPRALREKYFEPAPNGESRIIALLRALVAFRRLNLVKPEGWGIRTRFDVVFCRNVAIYFDRPTQETVFKALAGVLEPTGYLMSGHSENLHWLAHVLRPVGNTVHVLAAATLPSGLSRPSRISRRPPTVPISSPPKRGASIRVGPLHPAASAARLSFVPAPVRFSVAPRTSPSSTTRSSFGPAAAHVSLLPRRGASIAPRGSLRPRASHFTLAPHALLSSARLSLVAPSKREVSLTVGGIHASAKGAVIRTTLGSCVAACLWDPERRIGGMNHFLLPEDRSGIRGPTNFGVNAMEILINSLMKLGGDRRRFIAKLFGGADQQIGGSLMVGQKNAEFAMQYLEAEGIPVVGKKLGGIVALSVVFDTGDGKVRVKTLERDPEVATAERGYLAKLVAETHPVDDDIIFFGTP